MTDGFDASRPNIARVYDYWLGGKDNFDVDREQAEQLLAIFPGIADAVRANRQFVGRAVTWAAREGLAGCPIGTLATEVAGRNEDARLQAAAGFDAWERLLADALERMRERGELRTDAPPATLATGLLASIEGGMVLSAARKDITSLRIAIEAGLAQVRAHLN